MSSDKSSLSTIEAELAGIKDMISHFQESVLPSHKSKSGKKPPGDNHQLLKQEINALKIQCKTLSREKEEAERNVKQLKSQSNQKNAKIVDDDSQINHSIRTEAKNLKHEVAIMRQQVQTQSERIKELEGDNDSLAVKLREKERVIASFAIWRKSLVYSDNRRALIKSKIRDVLPVPQIVNLSQISKTEAVVKVKLAAWRHLKELYETIKMDKDLSSDLKDPLVTSLKIQSQSINISFQVQEEGDFEFKLENLVHGSHYKLRCFIEEEEFGAHGKEQIIEFTSDLPPPVPDVSLSYNSETDSIAFHMVRNWETVSSFQIHTFSPKTNDWQLLTTIEAPLDQKTVEHKFKTRDEGTHIFRLSQMNKIATSAFTADVAVDISYPEPPLLENLSYGERGELLTSWKVSCDKAKLLHVEHYGKGNLSFEASTPTVHAPLKLSPIGKGSSSSSFQIRSRLESVGGQFSEWTTAMIDLNKIPPRPNAPQCQFKAPSSISIYPQVNTSTIATLTSIQTRHRLQRGNNFVIVEDDLVKTTAGTVIENLAGHHSVGVSIRYAINQMWSEWSEWTTVMMKYDVNRSETRLASTGNLMARRKSIAPPPPPAKLAKPSPAPAIPKPLKARVNASSAKVTTKKRV